MHEDLLNAVSALVHRHVLRELHAMTGAMLARLDRTPAKDPDHHTNGLDQAPAEPQGLPATARQQQQQQQPKASTIERRERKRRAAERAGAKVKVPRGQPAPDLAPDDWLTLRQQVRSTASARGLSYREIAPQLGVKRGSLSTWLSRDTPAPTAANIAKMRAWLAAEPVEVPNSADQAEPPPAYTLSEPEQMTLRGYISLGADRDLRQRFGVNQETLGKAAGGEHMATEIIQKLRTALANGVGAE